MTTQDVRDMLGLSGSQAPKPKSSKKKAKVIEKRPDGITRELYSLMGDRLPPIPINQPVSYRAKPSRSAVRSKWSWTPFRNDARTDDITLRHWMKTTIPNTTAAESGATPSDGMEVDAPQSEGNQDQRQADVTRPPEKRYPFAKYNIEVSTPQYTTEQYDTHLVDKDPGWSQEETDYLLEIYKDCYGKWPIIADRYDYLPADLASYPEAQPLAPRSTEELKKRFYDVQATMMAIQTPVAQMNAQEYEAHSVLTNFDAQRETQRKTAKVAMLSRTKEEKREEEFLIAELKRIALGQEKFTTEIRDVRDRLDHSLTDDKGDPMAYTSCAEITQLFTKFANAEKNRRRPQGVPGSAGSPPNTAGGASQHGGPQKRASLSSSTGGPGGPQQPLPNIRNLAAREETRFGVSHPSSDPAQSQQRLTSGVSMRSDRLTKARTAKSATQSQKIQAVLTELRVPDVIVMPTLSVCSSFEGLVGKVNLLLDARKVVEKEDAELSVEQERVQLKTERANSEEEQSDKKKLKLKHDSGPSEEANATVGAAVKAEEQDGPAEPAQAADGDEMEAAVPVAGSTRSAGNKRSASVLSNGSAGSTRSRSKRKKGN
ncbi:MAG: swr complex subunit [Chrysothrix sp. TS-e1954]|nr:MAG: swr complex subunit [Chrysothrix sp. TS-e1954]